MNSLKKKNLRIRFIHYNEGIKIISLCVCAHTCIIIHVKSRVQFWLFLWTCSSFLVGDRVSH